MIDDPEVVLRIHVEVAELYEIGVVFPNQIAEGGKLDRIVGATGQHKVVQGDMAAIALHGCDGTAGISEGKTLWPVIGAVFFGLSTV